MRIPAFWFALFSPLLSPVPLLAIPSTTRTAEGRIVAVEPASCRFTFESADNQKRFVFTWNRRTLFGQKAVTIGASPLRAGQWVRVSYRLPLFGPDYASRVAVMPITAAPRESLKWSSKSKPKRHP